MMTHPVERYVGTTVLLIYLDRAGRLSQRRVRIDSAGNGRIRGYCWLRRGPRLFDADRILAFRPDTAPRRSSG